MTAGQKAFTGTGTAWKLRGCEGAIVIVAGAGAVNFVSALTTDAAGEFRTAWTGPTLANAQYTMWLPSAVAATALANHQRLAEIIASIQASQPESANLTALASLSGDAETLVRFLANGSFDLVKASDIGLQDPNGSLTELAELTLAANRLIATDGSGNAQQIDLGTLGRALLALANGTSTQYVQGDGTLQAKAGLPISTATQTALNGKLNLSGGSLTGALNTNSDVLMTGLTVASGVETGRLLQVGRSGNNSAGSYFELRPGVAVNYVIRVTGADGSLTNWFIFNANGGLAVPGALSKGSGTFLIDHPLDPFNKNLRHGFVEAPRYDLIYRGTVQLINGRAAVDIDAASNMTYGTFAALTTNAVVTSLQNQEGFARLKPGPINGGSFEIICEDEACTDLVSWVVIAERNDPFVKSDLDPNTDSNGRFVPEFDKEDA